jgi:FkbM family methyltransferase
MVTPKMVLDAQQYAVEAARIAVRAWTKACQLEAQARLRDAGRAPRMPVEFRSQFGEDAYLWTLLDGRLDGFFIEVGAFDGYNYAVTYAFECLGWNGLLIEGIPERAQACAQRRPHSRVVHAAASRDGAKGDTTFTVVNDAFGGMLSFHKASAQHQRAVSQKGAGRPVTVPLTSLNELLKDHTGPIDVAIIDVEGAEIDLLMGFDLIKHKPRVILLEDNTKGADPALLNYMTRQPYEMVGWLDVNRIYIHRDEQALIERARWI